MIKKDQIIYQEAIIFQGFYNLCTFKTPTLWAVMTEQGDADCAFEMRNGVEEFPKSKFTCLEIDKP